MSNLPRYPIFVPSKDRAHACQTASQLLNDATPFRLVVEPSQVEMYAERFPAAELLVTPRNDMRLLGVRNWIRDVSEEEGYDRHWQLDDNINSFRRLFNGRRIPCDSGLALRVCEDITDRYTNIGVSGLNYQMFVPDSTSVPFYVNCHVYSISLINNRMPYRWRLVYNDDTDLCLQVLAGGMCTLALNVFMANKMATMTVSGGNTNQLYEGDGRVRMARALQRQWPYVVETKRRWNRAQHVVRGSWKGFDTPLERRTDIDWEALAANPIDEYGMKLVQVRDEIQSESIRVIFDEYVASEISDQE